MPTITGTAVKDWIHVAADGNPPPDLTWNEIATATNLADIINALGGDDTVFAGGGNDRIDGGEGADTMDGGLGNDTYVNANFDAGDLITEGAGGGTDTIESNLRVLLTSAPNVERVILSGTGNISVQGNNLNNSITGNAGNNVLSGGNGNDSLFGREGTDTLRGGAGNDTYINPAGDIIQELANDGTDTVQSDASFSIQNLAQVENITLTGSANIDATGNERSNVITGNSGRNILDGGGHFDFDVLIGGGGNDTYVLSSFESVVRDTIVEQPGGGNDEVIAGSSFSLVDLPNVERLTLTGGDNGTGNALNNRLTGNTNSNTLRGGGGADTLIGGDGNDQLYGEAGVDSFDGGRGNDTFYIDPGESVTDAGGVDTIVVGDAYSLEGTTIEHLRAAGDATGNQLNNNIVLISQDAHTLDGKGGSDTLTGSASADTLIGGIGNDTYINPIQGGPNADVIVEASNGGIDKVQTGASFSLVALPNVENLFLTGLDHIEGVGNGADNAITGNGGYNRLIGGAGNDVIDGRNGGDVIIGGPGDDFLVGGGGADTFRFATAGTDDDTIGDFLTSEDRFDLGGGTFSARVESAGSTTLTHAAGTILVSGVTGLSLEDWNALVVSGGRQTGAEPARLAATHDASAHHPALGHFGAADYLYA